jgi:steroid delta-isomerase-like uncharacterized protein
MATTLNHAIANVEIAHAFFNAYNEHDVNKMVSMCSEEGELCYVPMGEKGRGKLREVGKMIWSSLIEAFPDLNVVTHCAFGDDENVAAEVEIGGTQQKDFMQINNQGKRYDLPHAFLLNLNDRGVLTRITAYWDNASFYSQLGKKTLD